MGLGKEEQLLKKTKIICTIGPSSKDPKKLERLIIGGMDVARINTSHSNFDEISEIIKDIRKISADLGKETSIMLDLQGPKIRLGKFTNEIEVKTGDLIILYGRDGFDINKSKKVYDYIHSNNMDLPRILMIDLEEFAGYVGKGSKIFIDDGLIELRVVLSFKKDDAALCEVVIGGTIKTRKGVNIPNASIGLDALTDADRAFLDFSLDLEIDFVAQSFVRNKDDVIKLKKIIESKKSNALIIAKIENREAVDNFEEILDKADGIMIARGDLGIELDAEEVPSIQKNMIKNANGKGKPIITATQMLDSMIRNPSPTRAEVSDVANAIYDGTDAVMLSGETAAGRYPLGSLDMMVRIILHTESEIDYDMIIRSKFDQKRETITEAMSFAACEIASVLGAKAIITATQSGQTARHISKNKPKGVIIGVSPNQWVARQLLLSWGVIPVKSTFRKTIDKILEEAINLPLEQNYIKKGDVAVITGGFLVNRPGSTNFINVIKV
jgi:pyruvate kinase